MKLQPILINLKSNGNSLASFTESHFYHHQRSKLGERASENVKIQDNGIEIKRQTF
jgi:hypothetical protein